MFDPVTTDPKQISAPASAFTAALAGVEYVEQPDLEVPETFSAQSRYGFLRFVLSEPTREDFASHAVVVPFEAFGHSSFARRYAHQAIALSNWTSADGPKPLLPSEPYTPVLSALSIDYHATSELVPGDSEAAGAYFVVGPFGAIRAADRTGARLVPAIDKLTQAALLLGIRNLQPPAGLTLFFEIDAGTASAATVLRSGDTEWSYLAAGDAWRPLSAAALLIDSTQGFQKPGVIALEVPVDATVDHQSLPSGLVWLRALIRMAPESAARTLFVKTHASLARFEPGAAPLADFEKHLQSGLPAATITARAAQCEHQTDGRRLPTRRAPSSRWSNGVCACWPALRLPQLAACGIS